MYLVKLPASSERGVTLHQKKRGFWEAHVDEAADAVSIEIKGRHANGVFDLIINGELHRLKVEAKDGELFLIDDTRSVFFDIVHAADLVLSDSKKADEVDAEHETLSSPITGIIIEVPVKMGQYVERGAPVVIIEAMKMENAFGAPISGYVSDIHIESGKTIFVGDPLVSISGEEK